MVVEKAYAKINITLVVTGVLDHGFHSLETIMAPIDLHDVVTISKRQDQEIVLDSLLQIPNNIMIKAAQLFQDKFHTTGVNLTLDKHIPLEAGLAGGSADAAAVLRGMNQLFDYCASKEALEGLALTLGSDVPFCLYNHIAFATGRGEQLQFLSVEFCHPILLVKPSYGLSTKEVFSRVTNYANHSNYQLEDFLTIDGLSRIATNDLEQAACLVRKELAELKKEIQFQGVFVQMTGSGSTLFCLSNNYDKLKEIQKKIEEDYFTYFGYLCHNLNN